RLEPNNIPASSADGPAVRRSPPQEWFAPSPEWNRDSCLKESSYSPSILPASRAAIVGPILSLITWIRSHTAYPTGLIVTAVTASTSPRRGLHSCAALRLVTGM